MEKRSLRIFDPEQQQYYILSVTPTEEENILNGDYTLVTKLLDKEKEKENFKAAFSVVQESFQRQISKEDIGLKTPILAVPAVTNNVPGFGEELFEIVEDAAEDNIENNFYWTRETTKLLLQLYFENKAKFRNPQIKKKGIWADIKHNFILNGYKGVTEDVLDRKMRNMKKRYRTIKDNNSKQKTGRGRINWEYFEIMENIFYDDKAVNFGETVSSLPQETASVSSSPCSVADTSCSLPSSPLVECANSNSESEIAIQTPISDCASTTKKDNLRKKLKAGKSRELYDLRKKAIDIEAKRVEELQKLRESIVESNRIQAQRNEILVQMLGKK